MRNEQLYIDGELADIDEKTKITLNIKSNLFRDISKLTANNSYTVKLPKTVRNQRILQHADMVTSATGYAYAPHTARYFRNGVEIIKNGRASVMAVTNDSYEISIVWGLFGAFADLIAKGTTLNQLESEDVILFRRSGSIDTLDELQQYGFGYAYYNPFKQADPQNKEWSKKRVIYTDGENPVKDTETATDIVRNESGRIMAEWLHPVVTVPYVMRQIKAGTGVDFQFKGEAAEFVDSLVLPLINKKANALTFDGGFVGHVGESIPTELMAAEIVVERADIAFNASMGDTVKRIRVESSCEVFFEVSASYTAPVSAFTKTGATWQNGWMDVYSVRNHYDLPLWIVKGGKATRYSLNPKGNSGWMRIVVPRGYSGNVNIDVCGSGTIDLDEGDTFELRGESARLTSATIKATPITGDDVQPNGLFPIAHNLPEIKIVDFVKFLACITGTFPLQVANGDTLVFESIGTLWANHDNAADWTRRLIAQGAENKPKGLEFAMSDYAQHNLYKWKEDETVSGNYDGDLFIDNKTLDTERTVFTFPFAASDGASVPMYTKAEKEGEEPSYKAVKDRILQVGTDEDGAAVCYFDISMQQVLADKYADLVYTLNNAKVIKERMKIRDIDLVRFDEITPVYLAQYGSYFAVTEIRSDANGLADVTMLKLYFYNYGQHE